MTLNAIQAPIQILDERTDDAWSAGHITDRIVQHVWGLRYIDDLMLNRQDTNADGDYVDSGDFTHYALTDHQFSVIALIDSAANLLERVSYTPYGEARHHRDRDVDGDGDVDAADQTLVSNASGSSIYQTGYNVDADFDRNGVVDSNDSRQIGSASFLEALPAGWISSLSTGNVIGFSGYVFNREIDAGGLYTVRFRHYDPVWGRWTSRDPAGYADSMSLYGYGSATPLRTRDPFGLWDDDAFGGLAGVFRRWFWGGDGGEGLSRRRQLESAGAPDPIVPFDPLSEFYDAQMEAEAAMAQMVRDLAAFYGDIALEIIEGVLYAHIGGQVLKLVFKAGKWIVQGAVRVAGAVFEGMEIVVLGGFVLVYEGGVWVLKAMIAPTTTAQKATRHTIWGTIGAVEGYYGPESGTGPTLPAPIPHVSPGYFGGWGAGKLGECLTR